MCKQKYIRGGGCIYEQFIYVGTGHTHAYMYSCTYVTYTCICMYTRIFRRICTHVSYMCAYRMCSLMYHTYILNLPVSAVNTNPKP